jgi:hypothetical protein
MSLLAVVVIVFSWLTLGASADNPYPYRQENYVVQSANVLTQQVCLGTGNESSTLKDVDYGYEGQSIIAHSLSFTQTTNVTINVVNLTSWDYSLTYSKTLGTITATPNGNLVSIQATANSALYLRYESNTCLSKFRKVLVLNNTRLPLVAK